ncbi:hypothetical protein WOLCODRAFT_25329 [Wolfiporia cocos MD-104 SS10]|uniref:Uncharacterized protein n=1 Tax=Wolfiporia cocos (strain MD-104) TaxID=742152 RepID=A0A2H3K1U5_WOLCO|nr:hypothetical protein WOLCODRAFT_25329 [Wolfiporia cocos MD-104 SS10]
MVDPSSDATHRSWMICREYRWKKPLTKWDSLPCLRLEPSRPLYDCSQCGFANTLGHACPWCSGVCLNRVVALKDLRRRRRVSAPTLLSDAQKAQLARIARRSAEAPAGHTETPRLMHAVRRRRHRRAAVYSAKDIVATATTSVQLQPFLHKLADMREKDTPATPVHVTTATPPTTVTNLNDTLHDTGSDKTEVASSKSIGFSSQRTLRRKQRMTILRQRSSRSLRKRSTSFSKPTSLKRVEASTPVVVAQSVSLSQIPLGHPQRPLYTAIRKNMTPPTIPICAIPLLDNTQDRALQQSQSHSQIQAHERATKSLDIPRPATVGYSLVKRTYVPASEWTAGASLTGEAELRIDLARCRSVDDLDYALCEGDAKRGSAVKEKVKSLGRGLRGLLRGRA